MRVVILSKKDYAGSGFKMYEALLRYSDIQVSMYRFSSHNRYGHEQGLLVSEHNLKQVQLDVDMADIIHLKGDWPHDGSYCGVDLRDKPVVISVSGGLFRKKIHGGWRSTKYQTTITVLLRRP